MPINFAYQVRNKLLCRFVKRPKITDDDEYKYKYPCDISL